MDDAPFSTIDAPNLGEQLARRLSEQRQRAESFLASHREELIDAQSRLRQQLQAIADQVSRNEQEFSATRAQLDRRTEELRRQSEEVAGGKAELDARSESWKIVRQEAIDHYQSLLEQLRTEREDLDARCRDLREQQEELELSQRNLREESKRFSHERQELEIQRECLGELRQRLEARTAELDDLNKSLAEKQTQTEIQRHRIAEELRAQRVAQLKEIERQRAELETHDAGEAGRLERQLKGVEQQRDSLKAELETLSEEHRNQACEAAEHMRAVEDLQNQLADVASRFEAQSTELEASRNRQTELAGQLEETRQKEAEAVSQLDALRSRHGELLPELDALRTQVAELERHVNVAAGRETSLREQIEANESRRAELSAELDQARCRASEWEAQLNASRERQGELANELETLRSEAAERAAQLEAARDTETRLRKDLAAVSARQTELVAELETAGQREAETQARFRALSRQHEQLKSGLDDTYRREAELNEQVESLRRRCEDLETAAAHSDGAVGSEQYEAVRSERDRLGVELKNLRDHSRQLEQRLETADGSGQDDSELHRRYEMAMDDVREMKEQIAELERELEQARKSGGARGGQGNDGGTLDWETQKARILAALENEDGNNENPEAAAERLRIEQVVQRTDSIMADKDAEIQELQRLLEDQSNNLGSVAVGAAALGEIFDNDDIIREERENLKRLQQQWEEKLRKAEIDLSVERAKVARERAELEERLRAAGGRAETSNETDHSGKGGGRWLARLGLKNDDG
jgi:chromosome segregation ATPase